MSIRNNQCHNYDQVSRNSTAHTAYKYDFAKESPGLVFIGPADLGDADFPVPKFPQQLNSQFNVWDSVFNHRLDAIRTAYNRQYRGSVYFMSNDREMVKSAEIYNHNKENYKIIYSNYKPPTDDHHFIHVVLADGLRSQYVHQQMSLGNGQASHINTMLHRPERDLHSLANISSRKILMKFLNDSFNRYLSIDPANTEALDEEEKVYRTKVEQLVKFEHSLN
jgi:hypothetical protein